MEEAICGGVKTWQPSSILSNERQAIKRQAAQNGCMYARPAVPRLVPPSPTHTHTSPPIRGFFLPPPPGHWGADRCSQVHLGAAMVTGPGCPSSQPSGGISSKQGVGVRVWGDGWGEGGWLDGGVGLRKLKDMALFPISLGDNKKGMLEKGKQREESTKTKARARSV